MHHILVAVAGLSLAVSFIFASLLGTLYDTGFHQKQLSRNQVNVDGKELEHVNALLLYFKGDSPPEEDFYSAKELIHLEDVKKLLDNAFLILPISLTLMIVSSAALWTADRKFAFMNEVARIGGFALLALLLSGGLFLWDFDDAFIGFHHLFFDNDFWQLDPSTDHLIQLFPEPFFRSFATLLAVKAGIAGALLIAGSYWKA